MPVICSEHVGAGAMIRYWGAGMVYSSDSTDDLYATLHHFISNPSAWHAMQLGAMALKPQLQPDVAGAHIASVLCNQPSSSPWYQTI